VDYEKLAIALIGDNTLPPPVPLSANLEKTTTSLFVETLLPQKVESNTEITTEKQQHCTATSSAKNRFGFVACCCG
jgi:hypothetical protein